MFLSPTGSSYSWFHPLKASTDLSSPVGDTDGNMDWENKNYVVCVYIIMY